jgi:hypothetical protein
MTFWRVPVGYVCRNVHLQLCLGLSKDGLEAGGLHEISLDLELAAHEESLGLGGTLDELVKVLIGENEGN